MQVSHHQSSISKHSAGLRLGLMMASAAFGALACGGDASAAAPAPAQIEEVIVTAQRREENLQQVPIAVTAISGAAVEKAGVSTSEDLMTLVPSLSVTRGTGLTVTFIRGVGQNSSAAAIEQPVAFYVDGIYYGAVAAQLSSFNNISHVEVLRGPQGTLFGRNATGGLIQVVTKDPKQEFSGRLSVGYGNYETATGSLYVTGGLTENLAADASVLVSDQGKGWGRNLFNGGKANYRNDYTYRTKWLWTPTDATRVTFGLDYAKSRTDLGLTRHPLNGPLGGAYAGYSFAGGFYDADINLPKPYADIQQSGGYLRLEHEFEAFKLVSLTGARRLSLITGLDNDYTSRQVSGVVSHELTKHRSQEFQLLSPSDSKIQWIGGVYYYKATTKLNLGVNTASLTSFAQQIVDRLSTESYAGYGQATVPIFGDATNLTLGARYTRDKKDVFGNVFVGGALAVNGFYSAKKWSAWTYKATLDHQFNDDVMAYATYSTGFRSGSYQSTGPTNPAVEPEKLRSFEVGIRSDLLDRRLRLNVSAFHYDYKNLQLVVLLGGGLSQLRNAAAAKLYGGEVEGSFVLADGLTLNGSVALLNSKYTNYANGLTFFPLVNGLGVLSAFNSNGKELQRAPDFVSTFSLNYKRTIGAADVELNGSWNHNGGFFWEPDNVLKQKPYDLFDAYAVVSPTGGAVSFKVWGRNLGGKKYYLNEASGRNAPMAGGPAAPRTYGVSVDYAF